MVHDDPLSVVSITSPWLSTAKQVDWLGHAMAVIDAAPDGMVSRYQLAPPLPVETMRGPPLEVAPPAKHSLVLGHDTAARLAIPEGTVSVVHEDPPSFVAITFPPLETAQQSVVLAQEMEASPPMPPGAGSSVHVPPPLVVASISAPEFLSTPTAQQSTDPEEGRQSIAA
jgi:hypothetical protein